MSRFRRWAEHVGMAIILCIAFVAIILLIINKEQEVKRTHVTGTCHACGHYGVHVVKNWGKNHIIVQCDSCGCKSKLRRG